MEILYFSFQSLGHFLGMIIILAIILKFTYSLIFLLWNRFWRHWNIRKHGWPPVHCDGDGDPNETSDLI